MKKLVTAIICAAALGGPVAFAQSVPVQSAPAKTAPAAAAADPAAAKAVQELLISIKFRELMNSSMQQMLKNMPTMLLQIATQGINGNAKLSDAQKKIELDKAAQDIPKAIEGVQSVLGDPTLIDEMVAAITPLYARHFTAEEIGQLAQFYKSPLGVKMLATMPQITSESMQISQQVMMPRLAKYIEKFNKK